MQRGTLQQAKQRILYFSENVLFGYKLHAVCSLKGVFLAIYLTPANVHDIYYLNDISDQISDCILLGDKGYLSTAVQLNLFELANIRLDTPNRNNQK